MKKILWTISLVIIALSCTPVYEFNTDFSVPTALESPAEVQINVASVDNIVLSWTGGGATMGYATYEVLFDKAGGDFSNPIYRSLSDLGVENTLTLTHALLNTIARKAGIPAAQTGDVIWTVNASKGGEVKPSDLKKSISVTRGTGIDYSGNTLYLYGTASENEGVGALPMRNAAEGVFVIYTRFPVDGNIYFKSSPDNNEFVCYSNDSNKMLEGEGAYQVSANSAGELSRITVDLNTQTMSIDKIGLVKAIWGATYNVIGTLEYTGNGLFKADNCTIKFIQSDRPDTNPPSWLGWIEERYYFIAVVNGKEMCWGRKDGVSAERPKGDESHEFYQIVENRWDQWEHLWKMKATLDLTTCTITINTNDEGLVTHSFSNVKPL